MNAFIKDAIVRGYSRIWGVAVNSRGLVFWTRLGFLKPDQALEKDYWTSIESNIILPSSYHTGSAFITKSLLN